jgi:hypothetical protein
MKYEVPVGARAGVLGVLGARTAHLDEADGDCYGWPPIKGPFKTANGTKTKHKEGVPPRVR